MVREIGCGSIVVGTEATAEGFAIGLASKGPMADAAFGLAAESFCDTPVEAFDEAVGMRPAGPRFGLLKMHVPEAELAAVASLDDIVEVIRRLRISAAKRSVNSPPSSMRMYLEAFDGVE